MKAWNKKLTEFFKAAGKRIWKIGTRNVWLKLLSILFAIILWSYVVNANPSFTRTKQLTGISISATDRAVLTDNSLALATDLQTELSTVSVRVEAPQSAYSYVSANNVFVSLDLSSIHSEGLQTVRLKGSSTYGTVTNIYPDSVQVMIESLDSRVVPINGEITGGDTERYWYNILRTNPTQITVSGPASLVQTVTSAYVAVDSAEQTNVFSRAIRLSLLDKNNNVVDSPLLTRSASTTSVFVEVYPKRELPVSVDTKDVLVADGYQIDSITFQPETVIVAAEAELLEDIVSLPIEWTKTDAATQTYTTPVKIAGLSDFKYLSSEQVYMTVTISEEQDTVTLDNVKVNLINRPDALAATTDTSTISVTLSGPRSLIETLTSDDITANVDLTGLTAGNYQLAIEVADMSHIALMAQSGKTANITLTAAE